MRTLIGLGFLSLCGLSFAAAPVEDLGSRGQPPVMEQPVPTVAPVPAGPAPSQNQPLTELYFEVQALRDEVRDLRGQLEEQGNQLRQLQQRQLDDYQDLDSRISAIGTGASSVPATGAAASSRPPMAVPRQGVEEPLADDDPVEMPASGPGDGDYEAYTAAYNLLKARKVDEAIASFNVFVAKFPNSQYTANAYYWLGEIYVLENNLADAEKAFAVAKDRFPAHRKANDAKFKLAKVYHLQGKNDQARELLSEVAATNSSAAALAQAYLAENF